MKNMEHKDMQMETSHKKFLQKTADYGSTFFHSDVHFDVFNG